MTNHSISSFNNHSHQEATGRSRLTSIRISVGYVSVSSNSISLTVWSFIRKFPISRLPLLPVLMEAITILQEKSQDKEIFHSERTAKEPLSALFTIKEN